MSTSIYRCTLPVSAEQAFAWHSRPGALERLLPPWESVSIHRSSGSIEPGAQVVLRMALGPARLTWQAKHVVCEPPRRFVDEARRGPFARWRHEHRFHDRPGGCDLIDELTWALPLHPLSLPLLGRWVGGRLTRMFQFRHRRTAEDLKRHRTYNAGRPLRLAVSGASGLVGSQLVAFLRTGGHEVVRLVRPGAMDTKDAKDAVAWDPWDPGAELSALDGFDGVVHLAGAPIAEGRWTPARKRAIHDSRAIGTRNLANALARLPRPPRVLISASAIGYYGDRREPLHELSPPGGGFLADVCQAWEAAAEPARAAGVRVVHPRIGVVLDPRGGALARLLPMYRLGLGGPVGGGCQMMSWVSLDDLLGMLLFALTHDELIGPFNAVAPSAVTSRDFARTLGATLRRPALVPAPAFAIRAAFGEMGQQTVLAGADVRPAVLQRAGFRWQHGELGDALRFMLGRAG